MAIDLVRRDRLAAEFRAVADPDDDAAGCAQPRHRERIDGRPIIGEQQRALRDAATADPNLILDHHRHTGEGQGLTGIKPRPQPDRLGARHIGIVIDDGVDARIAARDAFEKMLGDIERIEPALPHGRRDGRGVLGQTLNGQSACDQAATASGAGIKGLFAS